MWGTLWHTPSWLHYFRTLFYLIHGMWSHIHCGHHNPKAVLWQFTTPPPSSVCCSSRNWPFFPLFSESRHDFRYWKFGDEPNWKVIKRLDRSIRVTRARLCEPVHVWSDACVSQLTSLFHARHRWLQAIAMWAFLRSKSEPDSVFFFLQGWHKHVYPVWRRLQGPNE